MLTDSEGVTDRTHSSGTHFFFFFGRGEGGRSDRRRAERPTGKKEEGVAARWVIGGLEG